MILLLTPAVTIWFSSVDRPEAIPQIETILDRISEWIQQSGGAARLDFYSAREEPAQEVIAPSKPAPKKAAAKKVTAAALAETVVCLVQSGPTLGGAATRAYEEPQGLFCHSCRRARTWKSSYALGASSGVSRNGGNSGPPCAQDLKAFGTSAQNKAASFVWCSRCKRCREPGGKSRVARRRRNDKSHCAAVPGHIGPGQPFSKWRSHCGLELHKCVLARHWYQRRCSQRTHAARAGNGIEQHVHAGATANLQKMNPALPVPRTEQDLLASGTSMCADLERFGGTRAKTSWE